MPFGLDSARHLVRTGIVKTSDRPAPGTALSAQIKSQIGRECKNSKPEDCVKYSMRLTADLLSFTEKNALDNGKANCVGYAVLCSRICNYAFQVNGMGYRAKPVVGYVSLYGVNLCSLLQAIAPQLAKSEHSHPLVTVYPVHFGV